MKLKRICVFCGSSSGARKEYGQAAESLGSAITERGLGLVYGGGNLGLMNTLAGAALSGGGEVIGVIPENLGRLDLAHDGLTELKVVGSMHERKALMAELADAFIALPGGMGTLEELAEAVTWTQLSLQKKSVGLLDVLGYFQPLIRFFDQAVEEGFLKEGHREILLIDESSPALLDKLEAWSPPIVKKYIERKAR